MVITSTYREKDWTDRIRHLGDEAESVYELDRNSARVGFIRSGLNRPPFHVSRLPEMERFRPDYIEMTAVGPRYVEVMGIGRDQTIKIKDPKWRTNTEWNAIMPVTYFVWNRITRTVAEADLNHLARLVLKADTEGRVGTFDDGRYTYYEIPWEEFAQDGARAPYTTARAPSGGHAPVGRSGVAKPSVRTGRVRRTGELATKAEGRSGDGPDARLEPQGGGSDVGPSPQDGAGSSQDSDSEAAQGA